MASATPTLRIRAVSQRTGIPRNTLITWERRYSLIEPARSANGYRAYSEADVQRLLRIKAQLDRGRQIGDVAGDLQRSLPESGPSALLDALLAYDAPSANAIGLQLATRSLEHSLLTVYLPLLHQVGELWERGRATIAQEHFATSWVRRQLDRMLAQTAHDRRPQRVLLAGLPGERHELGLMAIAVQLGLRGIAVTYLGADLPADDVARAANAGRYSGIAQSAVLPLEPAALRRHANRVRTQLVKPTPLILGGPGLPSIDPPPGCTLTQDVDVLIATLISAAERAPS